jgi:hypothetical protein
VDRMTPHNWVNHLRCHGPRWASPERRGQAREVPGREPHRDRWVVPRVEGADRGLLDPPGAVDGRGRRLGPNVSRSRRCPGSIPASTAPKASSGSVRCSSRRNEPGTGWMGSRAIATVITIESSALGGGRLPVRWRRAQAAAGGRCQRAPRWALPAPQGRFVRHDEPADERIQIEAVLPTCMRHWERPGPAHRWLTDNVQTA